MECMKGQSLGKSLWFLTPTPVCFTLHQRLEAQEYWSGQPIPSPVDLPDPGIEPGSPALQVDSLPTELLGEVPIWEKNLKKSGHMYIFKGFTLLYT